MLLKQNSDNVFTKIIPEKQKYKADPPGALKRNSLSPRSLVTYLHINQKIQSFPERFLDLYVWHIKTVRSLGLLCLSIKFPSKYLLCA